MGKETSRVGADEAGTVVDGQGGRGQFGVGHIHVHAGHHKVGVHGILCWLKAVGEEGGVQPLLAHDLHPPALGILLRQPGCGHLCAAQELIRVAGHAHADQLVGKHGRGAGGVVGHKEIGTPGLPQKGQDFIDAGQKLVAPIDHAIHVEKDGLNTC